LRTLSIEQLASAVQAGYQHDGLAGAVNREPRIVAVDHRIQA